MKEVTPVFSGGVGRSGTTVVGRILRKNSRLFAGSPFEIKFLTEAHGLIDLVFGQRSFLPTQISSKGYLLAKLSTKDSIKVRYLKFKRRVNEDWWIRTNRLGQESGLHRSMSADKFKVLLDELGDSLDSPIKAARNFIFDYVRNHRRWQGEEFWMDTTPANMMYADFIYRIFPEAKFIEMRRNPLDNIASVLKEPWGPNDPQRAILWWRDRITLATKAKHLIPPDSHLTLYLESLVSEKRNATYELLINHVGLADELRMRQYFEKEVTAEKAHIDRWKNDFENPHQIESLFNRLSK